MIVDISSLRGVDEYLRWMPPSGHFLDSIPCIDLFPRVPSIYKHESNSRSRGCKSSSPSSC